MSKFLFVSTYDLRRNTSGNIRTIALMNSLSDNGHTVHCIFVPSKNVSDKNIYNNLLRIDKIFTFPYIKLSCNQDSDIKPQKTVPVIINKLRHLLIKIYSSVSVYDVFEIGLRKLRLQDLETLDESYDYVVSSSEPRSSHKFAEKIIKLKNIHTKWVLYWGDPMSNDVASTKLFKVIERHEEERLIAKADISIYTNPCATRFMKNKYPILSSKIDWIPTSDFKPTDSYIVRGDIRRIGYFGDYRQLYRNIYPFYEACVENNFITTIIGSGDIELPSKNNVNVYGRMSRDAVGMYEKDCGILVVLENFSKTGDCIQVPGKLYHYGLTHKYVLVITESTNLAVDYQRYERFVFVENDKDKIAAAIKSIQDGKGYNVNQEPVPDFMYENVSKKFIEILQNKSV